MDHKGEEVVYQSTREAVEVSVFLQAFLEDLEAKGLDVHVAGYSAWDPALSVLLRHAKISLNLHITTSKTYWR